MSAKPGQSLLGENSNYCDWSMAVAVGSEIVNWPLMIFFGDKNSFGELREGLNKLTVAAHFEY
jgi:hypothetical protein